MARHQLVSLRGAAGDEASSREGKDCFAALAMTWYPGLLESSKALLDGLLGHASFFAHPLS